MKSYEQMARSVLSRRDQIIKREQIKKARFFRYAARISTACGALALSIGAVAVWHNIKDTQKDLDEFVRPTEPTTQTTVALPGSDSDNNNNSADSVVQDSTEASTTAVTTKVVVTSVSKNKEGEKVIVTTEVAVPVTQKVTRPTTVYIIGPSPTPTKVTTTRRPIGPSPTPTKVTTTRRPIGPSPTPTKVTTTSHIIGPSPTPTMASTATHPIGPVPTPTTVATTVTVPPHTEPPHTDTAPQPTMPSWSTTWAPVMTTTYATNTAAPPHTEPYTEPQGTKAPEPTTDHNDDHPAPATTDNPGSIDYNTYRSFELDGRYYNFMYDTYYGETTGMTMYYSGTVTFHDWNYQPVYEDVSIYANPGSYMVIVNLKSQGRYIWYNINTPFYN